MASARPDQLDSVQVVDLLMLPDSEEDSELSLPPALATQDFLSAPVLEPVELLALPQADLVAAVEMDSSDLGSPLSVAPLSALPREVVADLAAAVEVLRVWEAEDSRRPLDQVLGLVREVVAEDSERRRVLDSEEAVEDRVLGFQVPTLAPEVRCGSRENKKRIDLHID